MDITNRQAEYDEFVRIINRAEDRVFHAFGSTAPRISSDLNVEVTPQRASGVVVMTMSCAAPRNGQRTTTLIIWVTTASWDLEPGAAVYNPTAVRSAFKDAWCHPEKKHIKLTADKHAAKQGEDLETVRAWAAEIVAAQGPQSPLNV